MRVLVTRPAIDSAATVQQLKRLGIDGLGAPLLDIKIYDGPELDLDGVQAILLTSANGARAFAVRSAERFIPAYCVGDATAREAFALGFDMVKTAGGDVDDLAALVGADLNPEGGTLLHPAGSKVAGDLAGQLEAAGFRYRRDVLYEAIKAQDLPQEALNGLKSGAFGGVLLYSPRTGEAFARLVDKAGASDCLGTVRAYCLSGAVAEKIHHLPWAGVSVAKEPTQASLLSLLET